MRLKSFNGLLAILLVTSIATLWLVSTGVAKPVGPNPEGVWPSGTVWGTKLRLENLYIGEAWFGAGPTADNSEYFQALPDFMAVVFPEGGTMYDKIVRLQDAPPQSYSWYVKLYSGGVAPTAGTLSWVLENATHKFIPQDFSIVLDNASAGIHVNLRAKANQWFPLPTYATLYVDNAVNVSISPISQNGNAGENVSFTVTVQNTGRYDDNYDLTVDAGGWPYDISSSRLPISAGDNAVITLTVTLGVGGQNITVAAVGDYASDNCTATAFGMPVSVSISPSENGALPSENVGFVVVVKNFGENVDNYTLEVSDDAGWAMTLADNFFKNVSPGENRTTVLTVTIPDNENLIGVKDNVTVTVTSQMYPWASVSATCTARAGFYDVEVFISPSYQENAPGGKLNYVVSVSNTGTIDDSYELTYVDNIGDGTYWEENISLDNSLLAVPAGETATTTLRVTIPDNATPGTEDNITVTATSQTDNTVSDSDSCIAHVARLSVSISPDYQSGLPGKVLSYTVEIVNNENTEGDYYSVVTDNLGWKLTFGVKRITLYPFGEAWTILKVTVPENAVGCTEDNVTVTMVSMDNTVRYSGRCIAHATIVRGVEVSITPMENIGLPGAILVYTVTITNTGNVDDTYDLGVTDDAGWNLELSPTSLTIPLRSFRNATLSVTIPENAKPNTTDNIIVIATSRADNAVSAKDSCTAYSLAAFKLDLLQGWNLVSFPLASENDTPANLFAGMTYTMKYYVAPYGPFKFAPLDKPVELGVGYLLKLDNNKTVTVTGVPPENYTMNLVAGWQIVGFPLTSENTTPANLFAGVGYTMKYWEAPYGPFKFAPPDQPVELGRGYLLRLDNDKTVTIPI